MKRLIIAGTALLMCLTSCSFNPLRPKVQSVIEVDNDHPDTPVNSSPVPLTTEPPAVSPYTEAPEILCKVRHYRKGDCTKSDLFIQDDGRVWCGFYYQNEGEILPDNTLSKNNESSKSDVVLMDDKWMDAYLSETAEDDFMLFGDIYELGSLSEKQLDDLKKCISSVEADSGVQASGTKDDNAADYFHTDITVKKDGRSVRMPVHAELGKYIIRSKDKNAEKVHLMVTNRSAYYFKQWESLCEEKLAGA